MLYLSRIHRLLYTSLRDYAGMRNLELQRMKTIIHFPSTTTNDDTTTIMDGEFPRGFLSVVASLLVLLLIVACFSLSAVVVEIGRCLLFICCRKTAVVCCAVVVATAVLMPSRDGCRLLC